MEKGWDLRTWRQAELLRTSKKEKESVNPAHRCVNRIVELSIGKAALSETLNPIPGAHVQLIQWSEHNGLGRAGLGTRRCEPLALAVVAERALESPSAARQRFRSAVNDAERTSDDAVAATIANIILHVYRANLCSEDRARWARLQAARICAMLAYVGEEEPSERILLYTGHRS